MAIAEEQLGGLPEQWQRDEKRSILTKIVSGLWSFCRRKPLGAFGGLLLLLPVILAIFGPGVSLGPLHIPGIMQDYRDYELGKDVLIGPSKEHLMGTDAIGRDLFARLVYGARLSFFIGWSVFFISSTISTTLTIVSAYYIRTADLIIQRLVELFSFVPDLILIIAIFSIYGATPMSLILTLGFLRGFDSSRILRSLVISVRAMPFIEAAKSLGASDMRVIRRHVLPQIAFLIIVTATGGLANAVLVESGLAILGFGLDPNYPTFGNLLNASRQFLRSAPHLALFPGLVIFMLLLGSRLLGDALRDVLDPRLRGSGR
jgi:peptide/nickel transport system permease protein